MFGFENIISIYVYVSLQNILKCLIIIWLYQSTCHDDDKMLNSENILFVIYNLLI